MAPNSRIILTRHAQAEHNVDLDYTSESSHRHNFGKYRLTRMQSLMRL
jgi:hypothetical protein